MNNENLKISNNITNYSLFFALEFKEKLVLSIYSIKPENKWVNHFKKEVSPCHGYYYPNRCAKSLMNYALKLGYTYVDSEMPSIKNNTLLKKF